MRTLRPLLWSALASAAATVALPERPARACGGFFCDTAQPVNQAAERIIFRRGADGQVTAVIQILYEGPAERFAWMLPVAGQPEIRVSSDLAFSRLQQATNPRFTLNTLVEGVCRSDAFAGGPPGAQDAASAGGGDSDFASPEEGVEVLDRGTVGPYDYVIISVASGGEAPASAAVDWLQTNGFDIDALGAERIGPYLASGMNLLAFRLTKGQDAGAIRPVILDFGAGLASIPIRPTAVAAVEDMGVMVWVVGPHRAYPVNYGALELNEALVDWFNPGATYDAVVTEAANQAGGQGFVTEMSGAATPLAGAILTASEEAVWQPYLADPARLSVPSALEEVVWTFAGFDGFREALAAHLTPPAGATLDDVLRCPSCVPLETDADGKLADFDAQAFVFDVESDAIAPMRDTAGLFGAGVVTRLYTTMSASEMTVDPSFDFNPDLPEVSATHVADRIIECSEAFYRWEAPWRVELADGQVVRGFGGSWPFSLGTSDMPANARVRRVGPTGQGDVIVDNGASIETSLAAHNAEVQALVEERLDAAGLGPQVAAPEAGCHGGGASRGGFGVIALACGLVAGLAGRRRRRA